MYPNQQYNPPTECSSSASHSSIPSKSAQIQAVPFQVYATCVPAQTAYQFPNIVYQQTNQFNNNSNQQQLQQTSQSGINHHIPTFTPSAVYPYPNCFASGYPTILPQTVPINITTPQGYQMCMIQPCMPIPVQSTCVNYQQQKNYQIQNSEKNYNTALKENIKSDYNYNPSNYLKIEGSQTSDIPVSSSMSIQNHLLENQPQVISRDTNQQEQSSLVINKRPRDSKNSHERNYRLNFQASQTKNIEKLQVKDEADVEEPIQIKKIKKQTSHCRHTNKSNEGRIDFLNKVDNQIKSNECLNQSRQFDHLDQISNKDNQVSLLNDNNKHSLAPYCNNQKIVNISVMEQQEQPLKQKISRKQQKQNKNDNQYLNSFYNNQYLINDASLTSHSSKHSDEQSSNLKQSAFHQKKTPQDKSLSINSKVCCNKKQEKQQFKQQSRVQQQRQKFDNEKIQREYSSQLPSRFSDDDRDNADQFNNIENPQENAKTLSSLNQKERLINNQKAVNLSICSSIQQNPEQVRKINLLQFSQHSNQQETENQFQQNHASLLLNQQHHYYISRKNSSNSISNSSCQFNYSISNNSKESLQSEPEISINFDDIKSVDRQDNINQQQAHPNIKINIPNILKEFSLSQSADLEQQQQKQRFFSQKSKPHSEFQYSLKASSKSRAQKDQMSKQEKIIVEETGKSPQKNQQNREKKALKQQARESQNNQSKPDQSHTEYPEVNESNYQQSNSEFHNDIPECMKKGNCVKNVIKAFQNWCKDEITDEVILQECPYYIKEGLTADQIRKKLNRYTKTKTPNHQNLQRLVEHDKFNNIFLYFLKNPAQDWIITSSIKDKSQHQQFIKLLIEKWSDQTFFDGFMKVLKRKKNLVTNKELLNDKYYDEDLIS